MPSQPLAGESITVASTAPAAELAAFLLRDLGASVRPARGAADIADAEHPGASVTLGAYGPRGRFVGAPAHESAVAAVGGALMAQYTYQPGPAYLVIP